MPLENNFNQAPYFNDYAESKQFQQILFKPGVAVQTRELNQLQTLLQTQIERFGDNILKKGTILDGCNFHYISNHPYIKIMDIQKDGITATPSLYAGHFLRSTNASIGITGHVMDYDDGFESTDPNLKTLYINYTNSGANNSSVNFTPGEIVSIYDQNYPISKVSISNAGQSFSNNDSVVVSSAIVVNVSAGTFSNGEYLYQPLTGANVQIVGIDTTTLALTSQIVLSVKPRGVDLTSSANATAWTVANSSPVRNASNTVVASVEGVIGSGAGGIVTTDSTGKVVAFTITSGGTGYTSLPVITLQSANNTTGVSTLNLAPQNYIANVQISSLTNSVGIGYAFGITEGYVYQKGFFSYVEPQSIVVSKYSNLPDKLVVGFDTREDIIDYTKDASLLDNALNTENLNAPGADRLRLVPRLVIKTKSDADSNSSFFVLSEWSEGLPYKQNQTTAYNKINNEMAIRTFDEAGNFAIDKFQVSSKSPANSAAEGSTFTAVVDPGTAYINGYRVTTSYNYNFDVKKGYDVSVNPNHSISLDYGTFVRLNELAGSFLFSTGDAIDLYDTAKQYLSNTSLAISGSITAAGNKIGTANMRSLITYNGTPGTNNAIYKMYLFNLNMNTGKNFRDVKSVFYNGTNKGIADVVLQLDATTNKNVAIIEEAFKTGLVFDTGVYSLKSSNNNNYTYRTIDQTLSFANNTGQVIKSIASTPGEYFAYGTILSDADLSTLILSPTTNNLIAYLPISGNLTVTNASGNVVGTGSTFLSDLMVGDYVYTSNGSSNFASRVTSIVNNTFLTLASTASFSNNTNVKLYNYYPQNVPINLGRRDSGQTAHNVAVNANGNILTVQMKYANGTNMTFTGTASVASNASLATNIIRLNVPSSTKTANRNVFVKISAANNAAGVYGPWCLGTPDVFRLRGVYIGNSSVSNTGPNFASDFYIDHNQNDDFYDLSYLFLKPAVTTRIGPTDYILVQFDYGSVSDSGFLNTTSYLHETNASIIATNDGIALGALTTTYNTLEIPEMYTRAGTYYDLLNTFDFRPRAANTVAPSTTPGTAPINPAASVSFGATSNPANDKKFPIPASVFTSSVEQFLGRIDSVFIDKNNNVFELSGRPALTFQTANPPPKPAYSMKINDIIIKPYPNIPFVRSQQVKDILNTGIASGKFTMRRVLDRTLAVSLNAMQIETIQPTRYSMTDIGKLNRRLTNLEYYVGLSLLETRLKDRVVPSSLNPTLTRFKFGFFVDDFSTANFSDVQDPQYSAQIENDKLIPKKDIISTTYPGPDLSCQYIDYLIASQDNATVGPSNANCQPSAVTSNTWLLKTQLTNQGTSTGHEEVTDVSVTLSSVSAPVTLFGYFYTQADRIEIYQGNTLFLSSNNAINLTADDRTKLSSNAVPSAWFQGGVGINAIDLTKNFSIVTDSRGDAVNYAFKLAWTHNPANGLTYRIKTTKYSYIWRYALEYPINSNTVTCSPDPTPTPVNYAGTMVVTPNPVTLGGGDSTRSYSSSSGGGGDHEGTYGSGGWSRTSSDTPGARPY